MNNISATQYEVLFRAARRAAASLAGIGADTLDRTLRRTATALRDNAARLLEERGISAEVVKLYRITPFDGELLCASAAKTGCVLAAEECAAGSAAACAGCGERGGECECHEPGFAENDERGG